MDDLRALPGRLTTRTLARSLDLRESTGSTMDDARAALDAGAPEGHTVIADTQSAGRGSHGRVWTSPAGGDLYLSIALRPKVPLERLATMTLAVGLAVARTVESFLGEDRAAVKWPNDVLVDGAKCAGILVESRASSAGIEGVIVGIGLDCNREGSTLLDGTRITSIGAVLGEAVDRGDVAARLFAELERTLDRWTDEGLAGILPEFARRLAFRGEPVRLDSLEGELLGLGEDGSLVLRTARGVESFSAGRLSRI